MNVNRKNLELFAYHGRAGWGMLPSARLTLLLFLETNVQLFNEKCSRSPWHWRRSWLP